MILRWTNYSQSIEINIGPSDGGTIIPSRRPLANCLKNGFTKIQADFVSNLTQVLNNDILSQRIYGEKLPFKGWQKCISFFFCEKSAGCCLFIVLTLKCGIFTAFFTNVFGSMNMKLLFLLLVALWPYAY